MLRNLRSLEADICKLRSKEEVRMSLLQAEMQLVQHEENMLDIRKQHTMRNRVAGLI